MYKYYFLDFHGKCNALEGGQEDNFYKRKRIYYDPLPFAGKNGSILVSDQSSNMMKHLTLEQRYAIQTLRKTGHSMSRISEIIGVNKSTVSREIRRNCDGRSKKYQYELAHKKCLRRRKDKIHYTKLDDTLKECIKEHLEVSKWQPEQISNGLRSRGVDMVSTTTIYRYIHMDKKQGGILYKSLRRQKPYKYTRRMYGSSGAGQIRNRIDIDQRPEIVDTRNRIGDWEIDTMVGASHKSFLLTITERKTGTTIIRKLSSKNAKDLSEACIKALKPFEPSLYTITADNGKEFADHQTISSELNLKFYFAKPYHSWQRGTNENTNGLIRQFFPKRTDLSLVSEQEIAKVEWLLNTRPRKRLKWKTPLEVYNEYFFSPSVAFTG